MTIVSISDTHGKEHKLDMTKYPGDTLIHAGDWDGSTSRFLDWMSKLPYTNKILIAGNHQQDVEDKPQAFLDLLTLYPSITYLQDSEVTIDGIKFYGSPYSNEFFNWAFMEYEDKLEEIWEKIPDDTQVLITHGPAYNCHDKVNNNFGGDRHVGSKALQNRKLELSKLKLHVSGHIHEAYGQAVERGVTNVCASILDAKYNFVNEPITITI